MTTHLNNNRYTFIKTNYGTWSVTKETPTGRKETRITHDSLLIDWINDDSNIHQQASAKRTLISLFSK